MKFQRNSGFSYIEMIISGAIVMILYYVMFAPSELQRQQKHMANCAANLQKLQLSLNLYANEHQGVYPLVKGAVTSEAALGELVPKYSSDTDIFFCPGKSADTLKSGEAIANVRIAYAYAMGLRQSDGPSLPILSDAQVTTGMKLKGTRIFSEDGKGPGSNHSRFGGNIAFTDGHVETSGPNVINDLILPASATWLNPKP